MLGKVDTFLMILSDISFFIGLSSSDNSIDDPFYIEVFQQVVIFGIIVFLLYHKYEGFQFDNLYSAQNDWYFSFYHGEYANS